MNYTQAKAERDRLEALHKEASRTLDQFPRLPNGLHTDDVKATPEYQQARQRSARAFANLQAFNAQFVKTYKKEIRDERRAKTP